MPLDLAALLPLQDGVRRQFRSVVADHHAGDGSDRAYGGLGADTLKGGVGSDVLKAGSGADVFVFARGHGRDKITDFTPGSDLLDLSGARVSYDDLDISRAGKATVIDTGSGEIWLSSLRPGEIDLDDFIF